MSGAPFTLWRSGLGSGDAYDQSGEHVPSGGMTDGDKIACRSNDVIVGRTFGERPGQSMQLSEASTLGRQVGEERRH